MSDEANKAVQIATSTLTDVIYEAYAGGMANEVGTDWPCERIQGMKQFKVGNVKAGKVIQRECEVLHVGLDLSFHLHL